MLRALKIASSMRGAIGGVGGEQWQRIDMLRGVLELAMRRWSRACRIAGGTRWADASGSIRIPFSCLHVTVLLGILVFW